MVAFHPQRLDPSAHQSNLVSNYGGGGGGGEIRDTCAQMKWHLGISDLKLCPSNPKFKTLCAWGIMRDQIECMEHVCHRALRFTQTFQTAVLVVQHTCQVEIWEHSTSRQELWQWRFTKSHTFACDWACWPCVWATGEINCTHYHWWNPYPNSQHTCSSTLFIRNQQITWGAMCVGHFWHLPNLLVSNSLPNTTCSARPRSSFVLLKSS